MVVEHFRNGEAAPVYQRFRERGRLAPEGLSYVASWVDESMSTCFQIMETADRALLEEWMSHWSDLVNFEVHPVMTSQEAAQRMAPKVQA
jgi:oligoribonuclease (3'-5' exoribonuclease)